MNQIDRNKLLKMLGILALLFIIVGAISHFHKINSITLEDYAKLHPAQTPDQEDGPTETASGMEDADAQNESTSDKDKKEDKDKGNQLSADTSPDSGTSAQNTISALTGALLNGGADGRAMLDGRVIYPAATGKKPSADGNAASDADKLSAAFYYEPLSKNLQRYITGISYQENPTADNPQADSDSATTAPPDAFPVISYDDLRYVHILHYNFDGEPTEGELICNAAIAQDLLEIFYELYRNEYQIERVLLIEEYDGDQTASAEDDNTFCFGATAEDAGFASKHALGLALHINPLYNPRLTYQEDSRNTHVPNTNAANDDVPNTNAANNDIPNIMYHVVPAAARDYLDRSANFPYKIDENDLCCKLFLKHGFTWGGNRNSMKDYGYFQKTPKQ